MVKAEISREFLQQYTCLLEDWIPNGASLAIAMDGKYVYYFSGSHDIKLQEGQPILTGSIADTVLKRRKKVDVMMDDSSSGPAHYGIGYPIEIKGEHGALIVILPPDHPAVMLEPLRFLTGKIEDEWYPVPVEQITHLESYQKKTFFYTDDGQYSITSTLKDLSARLPSLFLRVHRSYIVNTAYIQRISRDFSSNLLLTLKDGTELPVSQTYVNEVKCVFGF